MTACVRMHTCCCCFNTAKGSVAIAIASILASLATFVFIVLGLVYWEEFSTEVRKHYRDSIGLGEDTVEFILKVIWWGNVFTVLVIFLYIFLCVLLIMGVHREQYKHMIPWISATSMIIPFFTISFLIQLIFGFAGGVLAVIIPALIVLIWCSIWLYGFFCAVSHYRVLKGDIHRPVATLWKTAR